MLNWGHDGVASGIPSHPLATMTVDDGGGDKSAPPGRRGGALFCGDGGALPVPSSLRHRHVLLRSRVDSFPRDLSRLDPLRVAALRHGDLAGLGGALLGQAGDAPPRLYPRGCLHRPPADLRTADRQFPDGRAGAPDAPPRAGAGGTRAVPRLPLHERDGRADDLGDAPPLHRQHSHHPRLRAVVGMAGRASGAPHRLERGACPQLRSARLLRRAQDHRRRADRGPLQRLGRQGGRLASSSA